MTLSVRNPLICIECEEESHENHPDLYLCPDCFDLYGDEPGRVAAAIHLDLSPSDFKDGPGGGLIFQGRFLSYLVLESGDQYDRHYKEMARQYLDELILDGLPDVARSYFDEERWIEDNESNSAEIMGSSGGDEVTIYDDDGEPRSFHILNS